MATHKTPPPRLFAIGVRRIDRRSVPKRSHRQFADLDLFRKASPGRCSEARQTARELAPAAKLQPVVPVSSRPPPRRTSKTPGGIIGNDRADHEHGIITTTTAKRGSSLPYSENESADSIGERIQPAYKIDRRAGLLHQPQRIQLADDAKNIGRSRIHHAREFSSCLNHRRQQLPSAPASARPAPARNHGQEAPRRQISPRVPRRQNAQPAGWTPPCSPAIWTQAGPARKRAHQQHPHVAHLAVVDHRQR